MRKCTVRNHHLPGQKFRGPLAEIIGAVGLGRTLRAMLAVAVQPEDAVTVTVYTVLVVKAVTFAFAVEALLRLVKGDQE